MLTICGLTEKCKIIETLRTAADLSFRLLLCHPSTAAALALIVVQDLGFLKDYSLTLSEHKLRDMLSHLFTEQQLVC